MLFDITHDVALAELFFFFSPSVEGEGGVDPVNSAKLTRLLSS